MLKHPALCITRGWEAPGHVDALATFRLGHVVSVDPRSDPFPCYVRAELVPAAPDGPGSAPPAAAWAKMTLRERDRVVAAVGHQLAEWGVPGRWRLSSRRDGDWELTLQAAIIFVAPDAERVASDGGSVEAMDVRDFLRQGEGQAAGWAAASFAGGDAALSALLMSHVDEEAAGGSASDDRSAAAAPVT